MLPQVKTELKPAGGEQPGEDGLADGRRARPGEASRPTAEATRMPTSGRPCAVDVGERGRRLALLGEGARRACSDEP